MSTIRPPFPNALPAAPQGPQGSARNAAQKAFFEAALGRAAPTQTQAQTPTQTLSQPPAQTTARGAARAAQGAEIQVRTTPVREIPQPIRSPEEAPQKILRPGSLLDIRV